MGSGLAEMRSVATGMNEVTETREVATSLRAGNMNVPADTNEIISRTNDGFITVTRKSKKCVKQKPNSGPAVVDKRNKKTKPALDGSQFKLKKVSL